MFPLGSNIPLSDTFVSLDLHGSRVKEAKASVKDLFARARKENYTNLTIITGRGKHNYFEVAPYCNFLILSVVK